MRAPRATSAYRIANEQLTLALTLLLVGGIVVVSAAATLCGSLLLVLAMLALSFQMTRNHHLALVRQSIPVTPARTPQLTRLVQECRLKLQPGEIETYVTPSRMLNAYTFGVSSPKVVVLYSSLLDVMDADELRFIVGHEMGHVRLGHTWLNSMIGGLAGVPSPFIVAALLALAFRSWNRSCEFSADRAGLLACGKPEKAITALIKLVAPQAASSPQAMQRVYQMLDAQDEHPGQVLAELVATHPLMIRRLEMLQRYANTEEYRRLQALVDSNLSPA